MDTLDYIIAFFAVLVPIAALLFPLNSNDEEENHEDDGRPEGR